MSRSQQTQKHRPVAVRQVASLDREDSERLAALLAIGLERWLAKDRESAGDQVDSGADLSVHTDEKSVEDRPL